ncbi:MAG: rod shape-determining protein MreC [Ruminococcaceae bacterium]|nr:rod shape-determining protein MreC [Oscillospiraceae bacterium]
MKRFWNKNGIWLLAAAAVIMVTLSLFSILGSGSSILENAAGVIASPFRSAAAAITEWFDGIRGQFEDVNQLQEENDALRREIAQLEEALRQAQTDSQENERLRNLLNLRQQRRDFVFESATITQRSASNWASTLTLNRGTSCNVALGDCVVDDQGFLVGVITEVGMNWSTVSTVLDTSFQMGATVFRTNETAVSMGDLQLMSQKKLKLSYLTGESSLIGGDLILTSGLGGYYPSDLVIGTVEEVKTDDSGLTQYAEIVPKVNLDRLVQVFVITDFQVID